MNGWLVVARCSLDDLPMGMEKDRISAVKLANILEVPDVFKQARRLGVDESISFSIDVLEFRKGVPFGGYELIKSFSE